METLPVALIAGRCCVSASFALLSAASSDFLASIPGVDGPRDVLRILNNIDTINTLVSLFSGPISAAVAGIGEGGKMADRRVQRTEPRQHGVGVRDGRLVRCGAVCRQHWQKASDGNLPRRINAHAHICGTFSIAPIIYCLSYCECNGARPAFKCRCACNIGRYIRKSDARIYKCGK